MATIKIGSTKDMRTYIYADDRGSIGGGGGEGFGTTVLSPLLLAMAQIPPETWGKIMDHLPLRSVGSALLTAKNFAPTDSTHHVKTVNVFHVSEIHPDRNVAVRFPNASNINVFCLLTEGEDLDVSAAEWTVDFLTSFPMLRPPAKEGAAPPPTAFLGGYDETVYDFLIPLVDSFPSQLEFEAYAYKCRRTRTKKSDCSPDHINLAGGGPVFAALLRSLGAAFREGSLDRSLLLEGILPLRSSNALRSVAALQPHDSRRALCREICESFPVSLVGGLLPGRAYLSVEEFWSILMSREKNEKGKQSVLEMVEHVLVKQCKRLSPRRSFKISSHVPADEERTFLENLKVRKNAAHASVHFYTNEQMNFIEGAVAYGCDLSALPVNGVFDSPVDKLERLDSGIDGPRMVAGSCFDRLTFIGLGIDREDFIIVDEEEGGPILAGTLASR